MLERETPACVLAVDIGNTRSKWALFDAGGCVQSQDACLNTALQVYFSELPAAIKTCVDNPGCGLQVVVSNVADPAFSQILQLALQPLKASLMFVQPSSFACQLSNGYQAPEKLGSDRWAALVAAWHAHPTPSVVVNAGTALTVDALLPDTMPGQGRFMGGSISPGLTLMRNSLRNGTAGVAACDGQWQDLPRNTEDAVQSGILSAMAGAVVHMLKTVLTLQQAQQNYNPQQPLNCIITGGDGALLAALLQTAYAQELQPYNMVMAENLVLQGLFLLAHAAKQSGKKPA